MTTLASRQNLERFYRFFQTYGTERLNGLDESYFTGLNASEKEEAWNFLVKSGLSAETIKGLYILDKTKAREVIKRAVSLPMEFSPYAAERKELETARVSMLGYLNSVDPEEEYITAMCDFAHSEFEEVRTLFAQSVPAQKVTPRAVELLKGMIFTETETIPLSSAITKLMLIHGLDFERSDPQYKSLYKSLRSDDRREKLAAMNRLEKIQQPDYV